MENRMKTQKMLIARHLLTGKAITRGEAQDLYGIARLAPRIHELKKDGYSIKAQKIKVPCRDGRGVYVSQYYMSRP